MKKRLLAVLVLAALAIGCAVPALAEEEKASATAQQSVKEKNGATPAGPDDGEDRKAYVEDELGFVSFENVERRIRSKNLKIKMLNNTINAIEGVDYSEISSQLFDAISAISDQKVLMSQMAATEPLAAQVAIMSLEEQEASLREQLDQIQSGRMKEDNNGTVRQLENTVEQLVMAGETTFIALKAMETQEGALQRQLASLNRTVEELELRYEMGQISALQLMEVKAGRSSLISGLSTLQMNIRVYKCQLEQLLGADITGEITLGAIPAATEEEIASMDVEKDWDKCSGRNYDIYAALLKMEQAEEDFEDTDRLYNKGDYQYQIAQDTWDAAEYSYRDTVESCELKFRSLHAQVLDYRQIYETALVSLECEKESFKASQLRFQQGTISQNALLTATDELTAAEETVANAANDLFASYNTYCWAVQHGILN